MMLKLLPQFPLAWKIFMKRVSLGHLRKKVQEVQLKHSQQKDISNAPFLFKGRHPISQNNF